MDEVDELASNLVDMTQHKQKKEHEQGHRDHANGEAFAFTPFDLNDDEEMPNGIGSIDESPDDTHPVCFLIDTEKLTGLAFSIKTARRLAEDLIAVCNNLEYGRRGKPEGPNKVG